MSVLIDAVNFNGNSQMCKSFSRHCKAFLGFVIIARLLEDKAFCICFLSSRDACGGKDQREVGHLP